MRQMAQVPEMQKKFKIICYLEVSASRGFTVLKNPLKLLSAYMSSYVVKS